MFECTMEMRRIDDRALEKEIDQDKEKKACLGIVMHWNYLCKRDACEDCSRIIPCTA